MNSTVAQHWPSDLLGKATGTLAHVPHGAESRRILRRLPRLLASVKPSGYDSQGHMNWHQSSTGAHWTIEEPSDQPQTIRKNPPQHSLRKRNGIIETERRLNATNGRFGLVPLGFNMFPFELERRSRMIKNPFSAPIPADSSICIRNDRIDIKETDKKKEEEEEEERRRRRSFSYWKIMDKCG